MLKILEVANIRKLKSHIVRYQWNEFGIRDKHWYLEIGEDCFCDISKSLNHLTDFKRSDVTVNAI